MLVRAAAHLGGGAPRESQHQDARRIDAVDHQMRDAVRQRVGLAGAGAGDDQQRARKRSPSRAAARRGSPPCAAGALSRSRCAVVVMWCGMLTIPAGNIRWRTHTARPCGAYRDPRHARRVRGPASAGTPAMKPDRQTVQFTRTRRQREHRRGAAAQRPARAVEVVHHPGGAAAVALDAAQRVCLLRQYRYVAGRLAVGAAGGQARAARAAARHRAARARRGGRRAARDTGTASAPCSAPPGVFSERLHLFLATGIAARPLALPSVPRSSRSTGCRSSQACDWALDGTISDCKTAVGLLRARSCSDGRCEQRRHFRDRCRGIGAAARGYAARGESDPALQLVP